jgi:hypothetical protein
MAKNLYMLECPAISEYNMETFQQEKNISYIKLLPLDYENQKPDKEESDGKLTVYKTNNPKAFWEN